jgi:hypothetical protein
MRGRHYAALQMRQRPVDACRGRPAAPLDLAHEHRVLYHRNAKICPQILVDVFREPPLGLAWMKNAASLSSTTSKKRLRSWLQLASEFKERMDPGGVGPTETWTVSYVTLPVLAQSSVISSAYFN